MWQKHFETLKNVALLQWLQSIRTCSGSGVGDAQRFQLHTVYSELNVVSFKSTLQSSLNMAALKLLLLDFLQDE